MVQKSFGARNWYIILRLGPVRAVWRDIQVLTSVGHCVRFLSLILTLFLFEKIRFHLLKLEGRSAEYTSPPLWKINIGLILRFFTIVLCAAHSKDQHDGSGIGRVETVESHKHTHTDTTHSIVGTESILFLSAFSTKKPLAGGHVYLNTPIDTEYNNRRHRAQRHFRCPH